nr:hypothetical protein GCM10010200_081790 [Actinomadura rugatobispora]
MPRQKPLFDYLALGGDSNLVANECVACGARYFNRCNAAPGASAPGPTLDCEVTSVEGNPVDVSPGTST